MKFVCEYIKYYETQKLYYCLLKKGTLSVFKDKHSQLKKKQRLYLNTYIIIAKFKYLLFYQ